MTTDSLPHLIKLADDDSEPVRRQVAAALCEVGAELWDELARLGASADERARVEQLLEEEAARRLADEWPQWQSQPDPEERLESALDQLARFQQGLLSTARLTPLLDDLAETYRRAEGRPDPLTLARYLFEQRRFQGSAEDYYHPRNSNLIHVIQSGRGLPISLTCIYKLVGSRLGLQVEGCNFPGHFMARIHTSDRDLLVDCFHGKFFEVETFLAEHDGAVDKLRPVIEAVATPRQIVSRVLRNLIWAYHRAGQEERSLLMVELLRETSPGFLEPR